MARANDKKYDELLNDNQFLNWFWSKGNSNKLIQFLNKHTQKEHNDELRRERYPPFVYGLVLNYIAYHGTSSRGNAFNKKFRLMKIGFSELIDNRIKQITKIFNNLGKQITVMFYLRKNAVDTTWRRDFEKRIRNNFEIPIRREYAKSLGLEELTEWVLTTTGYIEKFKKYQEKLKELGSLDASILKVKNFERFKPRHRDKNFFSVIIREICGDFIT